MDKSDIIAVTPAQPGTKALYFCDGEVVVENIIAWVTVDTGDPEMFPMTLTGASASATDPQPDAVVMPDGSYSRRAASDVTEQQIREALQYDNNVYTGK